MADQNKNKKKRFSKARQVETLKPLPDQRQTEYYHATVQGLVLRVGHTQKTWAVKYMLDGQRKKITLKLPYPEITLAEAVEECKRIRADATRGIDPLGKKKKRKAAPTIKDVMDLYLEEVPLTEKGKTESIRICQKDIIPLLGNMKAMDLRRKDVKSLHKGIVDRGAPVAANRTIELLRRAFNHAHEEELLTTNPFPKIKKVKATEATRDRVLTDAEIKTLWMAMDDESANMRDILRLLLLLGQRSTDTMSMRVDGIDKDRKEWTVPAPPRAKNQNPNVLPLPPLAWAIIEPRLKNDTWIFPSKYGRTRKGAKNRGHSTSTKDVRRRLRQATKIEGWTAHDFRRTCRTLMSRGKVKPHIAERVLGHVQGGVEGIYDRYAYVEEKGAALRKVERIICKIVGAKQEPAKVIELKTA